MDQEFMVPGFLANGMCCGIKEDGRKDLSLIFSTQKATAAGVFTKKRLQGGARSAGYGTD